MTAYDYDLFVIGAGSGGVRAARLAALSGARVAVAEEYRTGGTCVIRGCVPKKFMVYASEFTELFRLAEGYGWTVGERSFNWREFMTLKDAEISRLSGIYAANLGRAGAELLEDKARFVGPHTLELVGQGRRVTAAKVLVATGGRPKLPAGLPGVEHAISSNEVFQMETPPASIVVVGGGYIAVEFACIFHGLGIETTLLYRGSDILRGFDDDVRAHLSEEMQRRGLRIQLSSQHDRIEKTPDGLVSHLRGGEQIVSQAVMFATGREPYVEGLGLDVAGVDLTEGGAVKVDEYSRTSVSHIWAVGDVTDRVNLTPVAIREGAAFAQTEFYNQPTRFDHEHIATAVFSQPQVACVGLSEGDARRVLGEVEIYRTAFRPMKTLFAGREDRVLMKLVVDKATDRVVGCHIVGPDSAEMIQLAAIAVKAGLTKAQWDATCAVHPTLAEELVTMREPYVPPEVRARA
jgi:glutathione reductase (NADPH)